MELTISKGIIEGYFNKLQNCLDCDVAIAGGGPSGLTAAYYLAKNNIKTVIYESKLAPGGGMWGGAMLFNKIIVQEEAVSIIDAFNISKEKYDSHYTVDSIEATSSLIYHAVQAGAHIFNGIHIEDVVFDKTHERIKGIVINWSPVVKQQLHVDPLIVCSKAVLDSTGHPCEIVQTTTRKNNIKLNTPTGTIIGERSLSAREGERMTVENTKEVYPGLFVSGMAANGVSGSFRMGPIFGGMLLSGKKAAEIILNTIIK